MYTEWKGYKSPANFAKDYVTPSGKVGVNRNYIHQLILKEKANPESTGIDVLEIDGNYYVRKKPE